MWNHNWGFTSMEGLAGRETDSSLVQQKVKLWETALDVSAGVWISINCLTLTLLDRNVQPLWINWWQHSTGACCAARKRSDRQSEEIILGLIHSKRDNLKPSLSVSWSQQAPAMTKGSKAVDFFFCQWFWKNVDRNLRFAFFIG